MGLSCFWLIPGCRATNWWYWNFPSNSFLLLTEIEIVPVESTCWGGDSAPKTIWLKNLRGKQSFQHRCHCVMSRVITLMCCGTHCIVLKGSNLSWCHFPVIDIKISQMLGRCLTTWLNAQCHRQHSFVSGCHDYKNFFFIIYYLMQNTIIQCYKTFFSLEEYIQTFR